MAFQNGTVNDLLELFEAIRDLSTNRYVTSAAINAAGTGYVVGDFLTVAGGTSLFTATIRVTSVGGSGEVTGIKLWNHGAYTVDPTTTANAVTGGTGSGATIDLTMSAADWTVNRDLVHGFANSIQSIANGGSNYQVSDVLTLVDTTGFVSFEAATVTVDAVDGGGAITAASVTTSGKYLTFTSGALAVTGGAGTGALIDPQFSSNPGGVDNQLWLESTNADAISIGFRMFFEEDDDAFQMEVRGATGFDSGQDFFTQPGDSGSQCYVPLANQTMEFWLWWDEFRIMGVVKIGTTYVNFYQGFVDRFATESEYPYPLLTLGCCSQSDIRFSESVIGLSGMTDPLYFSSSHEGPGRIRGADGNWRNVRNGGGSTSTRSQETAINVWPCGDPQTSGDGNANDWYSVTNDMDTVIPSTGTPGNPQANILPTPNTGGDLYPTFPATIVESTPAEAILGQMRGVFWVSSFGGIVSEDEITDQNGDIFIAFQNCNRTETFTFFALKVE